jgi:hypothetical protein
MLLAFASLALADVAAAPTSCLPPTVFVTLPAPLATNVPVDAVPAALLSAGDCGGQDWTGVLIDAGTGAEVVSVTHSVADGRVIEVDPGADLAPDTTYTLRFSPNDGSGELTEIGFTTGTGTSAGLDGGPMVESAAVVYDTSTAGLSFQVEAGMAGSEDGPTIVAFGVEGEDPLDWTSATGPAIVLLSAESWDFAEAPEEVCVTVRQRDITGAWSESPSDCVAPEIVRSEGGGCNVAGGSPISGLFGLLLAAGLVRRARR